MNCIWPIQWVLIRSHSSSCSYFWFRWLACFRDFMMANVIVITYWLTWLLEAAGSMAKSAGRFSLRWYHLITFFTESSLCHLVFFTFHWALLMSLGYFTLIVTWMLFLLICCSVYSLTLLLGVPKSDWWLDMSWLWYTRQLVSVGKVPCDLTDFTDLTILKVHYCGNI